jgi:hypothetical protein
MLDARLKILLCKKNIVTKSKEVKAGCNLAETSRKAMAQKGLFCQ